MDKKYKLLKNDTINHSGKTLYRIKRLSDNLLGGYIENESNLSHYGNCFVYDNARVYGDAWVYDGAWVSGNAIVYGDARVSGDARVFGNALVYGYAHVYNNARVCGNIRVYGDADIYGKAVLRNYDEINNTKQYLNILGFEYPITITYSSINIGCKSFTIDELDTVFYDKKYSNNNDIPMIKAMIEIALEKILRDL